MKKRGILISNHLNLDKYVGKLTTIIKVAVPWHRQIVQMKYFNKECKVNLENGAELETLSNFHFNKIIR